MANTVVVNEKNRPKNNIGVVYVGRPSVFGNPFRIGLDGNRAEVIQKFEKYARERISRDALFREQVKALHGRTISCWCKPLACHGDILARLADELNQ